MKQVFLLLFVGLCASSSGQPIKSFFYKEQELSIPLADGVALYGTLTVPASSDSGSVVAIIVAGSGPTDRDGNQYGVMYPNSYKFLAHDLAQLGVSTFRFDKRGVGASITPGINESKLTFDTYIRDVENCMSYFREHHRFKSIVLIGHSEGALISFVAGKRSKVNACVSLAAPAAPMDSILIGQVRERMPALSQPAALILGKLRNKQPVDSIPKPLATLFRPGVQPFLTSIMAYNPSQEIRDMAAPVLIVQGDNDLQIKEADATRLAQIRPDATLAIIPGMNHVLKISEKEMTKNLQLYNSPATPIPVELPRVIRQFLTRHHLLDKK